MNRERLIWLLALLALVASGWWLSVNTEWVDEDTPRPAQGEARDNPVYAFEQLLRKLGMKVERHEALNQLPPARARLLLLSNDWALFPQRAEALHQWVQRGGHLVVLQGAGWDDTSLERWVPVLAVDVKRAPPPEESASAVPAASEISAASAPTSKRKEPARLTSTPPFLGGTAGEYTLCDVFQLKKRLLTKAGQEAEWTMARNDQEQVLRIAIGQGTVTVLNAASPAFHNSLTLRCDNSLLLAAALQAEPGATAWIYLNEKREALLPWLWNSGWIAILLGLLALAAALWRAAVRFGPRLATPPRLRRSISEQVRGLGAYLHREGREALLTAQQRALNEAATRHLPGYARMPMPDRLRALSAVTQLPAEALSTAIAARTCNRVQLVQHLQLLEAARRRLPGTKDKGPTP